MQHRRPARGLSHGFAGTERVPCGNWSPAADSRPAPVAGLPLRGSGRLRFGSDMCPEGLPVSMTFHHRPPSEPAPHPTVDVRANSLSSQPADLVAYPSPVDEQLAAYVAGGDRAALCEFAEALAAHRDRLWAQAKEVAAQEQALAALIPAGASGDDVVPAAAVAACLASLVVETGDDVATLSIALDLPPAWVRGVLSGEVTTIDTDHLQALCAALESSPQELFGPAATGLHLGPAPVAADELAPPVATTSAQQLTDIAGFLRAGELAGEVGAMTPEELEEFAAALGLRHAQLEFWAEDLAVRAELATASLRPLGLADPVAGAGDLELPAAAAANQIRMLMIDSGDDLDTVAHRLGLDPSWARGMVDGVIDFVDAEHGRRLCDALELSPAAVFGVPGMALEGPGTAWAVVPYDPFDHEAHLEHLEPSAPTVPELDIGP